MKGSKAISRALEKFEDGERWTKGSYFAYDNRMRTVQCLMGGLILGYGYTDDSTFATEDYLPCTTTIATVISEQFPDRLPSPEYRDVPTTVIVEFNDNEFTTFDDVRLVLEKARLIEQDKEAGE